MKKTYHNRLYLLALTATIADGVLLLIYLIAGFVGIYLYFSESADFQHLGYQIMMANRANSFFVILLSFFLYLGFKVCRVMRKYQG